jgi:hypothetical protein
MPLVPGHAEGQTMAAPKMSGGGMESGELAGTSVPAAAARREHS